MRDDWNYLKKIRESIEGPLDYLYDFSNTDLFKDRKIRRALPKMDDPAEILRALGKETLEQLETFLEENELELDALIYRDEEGSKIWEGRK